MSHCWTWSLKLSRRKYLRQDFHGQHGVQSVCCTMHSAAGGIQDWNSGAPCSRNSATGTQNCQALPKRGWLSFNPPALWSCHPCQGSLREHKVPFPWVQTWDPRTSSSKQQRIQHFNSLTGSAAGQGNNFVHRIPKPGWQLHPVQLIN